jgi:hypothetical protein
MNFRSDGSSIHQTGEKGVDLFDGKTLAGWTNCSIGKAGEATIVDGEIDLFRENKFFFVIPKSIRTSSSRRKSSCLRGKPTPASCSVAMSNSTRFSSIGERAMDRSLHDPVDFSIKRGGAGSAPKSRRIRPPSSNSWKIPKNSSSAILMGLAALTASALAQNDPAKGILVSECITASSEKTLIDKTANNEAQALEIYFPVGRQASQKRSVMLFFHGGSWKSADSNLFCYDEEYFCKTRTGCGIRPLPNPHRCRRTGFEVMRTAT